MDKQNLFPLNSLDDKLADVHEPEFFAKEFHKDIAVSALVAGTITVDVDSAFGKDIGEVYGGVLLNDGGTNEVIGINAVASSTAGKVTVTINSSDATSTTALGAVSFWLFGRPKTTDYSY